ncbi:hypothetical protein M514_11115 [Trichuris suis]|uniref:Uncharacterized protein n=1 Tax=Trichuris suis TaxID=68888 RepID=A0A085LST7_9BILA|nr:hypothetical protein M513_11115 [Trichuris suis]KFD68821.1 hypothetical protein M514_11115 [Trichuris suis]
MTRGYSSSRSAQSNEAACDPQLGVAVEILDALETLSISHKCDKCDANMWLACDNRDAEFQTRSGDEIDKSMSTV